MMKPHEVQAELDTWTGAIATVHSYTNSHGELHILYQRPGIRKNFHLICVDCKHICTPVVWGDANTRVRAADDEAEGAIEVIDSDAGMRIVCNGVRTLHDVEPVY